MGIFDRLLRRSAGAKPATGTSDERPIVTPIHFRGPGVHRIPLEGSGFAVVFEDDGCTGYLYATNETGEEIFDALHLYDHGSRAQLVSGEEALVLWSSSLRRAGLYYHDEFVAVFDFAGQRGACRSGFPPPDSRWCKGSHDWDDELLRGLVSASTAGEPRTAEEWIQAGHRAARSRDLESAARSFTEATRLSPDNVAGWYGLASAQSLLGRKADALTSFRQAVALDEDSAGSWYGVGTTLADLGDLDGAAASLERARRLAPEDGRILYNLIATYQRLERSGDARALLDELRRIDPDRADRIRGL
jgi:hypothetical protein